MHGKRSPATGQSRYQAPPARTPRCLRRRRGARPRTSSEPRPGLCCAAGAGSAELLQGQATPAPGGYCALSPRPARRGRGAEGPARTHPRCSCGPGCTSCAGPRSLRRRRPRRSFLKRQAPPSLGQSVRLPALAGGYPRPRAHARTHAATHPPRPPHVPINPPPPRPARAPPSTRPELAVGGGALLLTT